MSVKNTPGITFFDLQNRTRHDGIDAIFPGWEGAGETVVILVPHDDDLVLGAGYLVEAVQQAGGRVGAILFCNGCAGYSTPELAPTIVDVRRAEMEASLAALDIPLSMFRRLEYPDFSAIHHVGWRILDGTRGSYEQLLRTMREWRATRLVYANGYLEHIDHLAVELAALYDGPQVGDPAAVDLGVPSRIRTYLQYCCWGKFSPMDALTAGRDPEVRANWAITVPEAVEQKMCRSIAAFVSQGEIITHIMNMRQERGLGTTPERYMELYLRKEVRPRIDHEPYRQAIAAIAGNSASSCTSTAGAQKIS